MATPKAKLSTVDPVWDQITAEARQTAVDEPLMGGFVHACILHH